AKAKRQAWEVWGRWAIRKEETAKLTDSFGAGGRWQYFTLRTAKRA
uniref:Uncharacterized protein n=1 Tax=Anopheles atroparvus TaxID=41427 RepID=A0AAG5DW76_ANOAO